MSDKEVSILLNFLKSGLTTRELDHRLGLDPKKTKGWPSWEILKKYHLLNSDRSRFFCYTEQQCRKIIADVMRAGNKAGVRKVLSQAIPNNLEKYRDTYVVAKSEGDFLNIFSGETRNITQNFFSPLKKLTSHCQFHGCAKKQLDTVHILRSRPSMFRESARKSIVGRVIRLNVYNIYQTMYFYLQAHSKKRSICFLCKTHHRKLHDSENKSRKALEAFKHRIIFE